MDEKTVLIIDEEELIRKVLDIKIKDLGYQTLHAMNKEKAMVLLNENKVHIVLCDVSLSGESGFVILKYIKENYNNIVVIMMTASANLKTAVKAFKFGAFDYLIKPFTMDEIPFLLNRAILFQESVKKQNHLNRNNEEKMEFFNFFGISNYIHIIKSKIKEVIENASPVLINGPIGTGKKTIAKIIVNHYPHRLNDNYYYINLLDIAESKETILRNICRPNFMVKQNTNMVMMDHCEALDFSLQKYFISNKNNNIKYIFITNKKIEENNFQQYFKEEFYQLIRVNHLVTKSLKEHKEDIPFLIQYFLNQYNEKYKKEITEVEKDALSFLLSYNYPENILELERIIEKIVMIADDPIIKLDLLNQFIRDHEDMKVMILNPSLKYKQALKLADSKVDRYYFNMALKLTNYNKTKAAKLLNISLRQFQYKCRELGL